jgi:hypothetical protein
MELTKVRSCYVSGESERRDEKFKIKIESLYEKEQEETPLEILEHDNNQINKKALQQIELNRINKRFDTNLNMKEITQMNDFLRLSKMHDCEDLQENSQKNLREDYSKKYSVEVSNIQFKRNCLATLAYSQKY